MESWSPGARFGELEIVRELGRGAFGRVYLAKDTLVGRQVALKLLRLPDGARTDEERKALLGEARLVGQMKSPHVATLYRVHALPDGWAFELEYVEGGSLEDLLARAPRLPTEEARRVVRGILRGLSDAHEQGIVHGDIKPGNVLLARDGAVKLVDFGLARLVGDLSLRAPLAEVVGTPVYMAPEVGMGEPVTPFADLWSAGVILYRMLSGRLPFAAKTLPALFYAIQNSEPPPLDPGLPGPLAELTMRCLSKPKESRPPSCAAALADLEPAAVAEAVARVAARPGPAPRLHGRHREQEKLQETARRAAAGQGTTAILRGDAGSGKSALARDLVARSARYGFRWIEARVTPLDGVLRPLLVGVRELLGPPDGAEQGLVESRLFGTATNLLRALLEEQSPIEVESRQQVFWGVEDLLSGIAAQGPLGILVEDVHQADAGDLRLLTEMARRLAHARVLLVIALRPGPAAAGLSELAAQPASVSVEIPPLEADAVSRVLQERAQGARLSPEVLHRVLEVAEGNPLLTIEVFRHLEETGALGREAGVLVPGPAWSRATLPRRVRELVVLRLRDLSEDERAILDVAAVDGLEFEGEAVAAALGRPILDVLRTLQQIYRRTGLIVPRTRGYRFASAALQEGTYEELAPDLRRTLHRCLAEHLETLASGASAPVGRLGLHWEGAGETEKARPHLLRAAREALQRQEFLRAVDLVRRAGLDPERLDADTAVRHADLLLEHCGALVALGRQPEMEAVYARLLEGANSASDVNLALKVTVRRAGTRYESRGLAGIDEEALRHAARHLPARSVYQGHAWYLLGRVAKYRGDLSEAERCFRSADEAFVACGNPGRHSSCLDQLGSVALRRGRWREAEALYGDASRISGVAGRRTDAAVSEVNRALAALHCGALETIGERLEKAIRVLVHEGSLHHAANARNIVADVRYALGNLGGAKAAIDEALPPLRAERYLTGLIPATLARAQFAAVEGSLDLARQTLSETRRLAQLRGDAGKVLEADVLECHVACFAGDRADSRRAAKAALATGAKVAELPPRADALLWLAEAGVYGLPIELIREAERLVVGARADDAHFVRLPLALLHGVLSLAEPRSDPHPMLEAARLLAGEDVGPRRAVLRILGGLLEVEARARAGDSAGARERAERALADAHRLGHAWLGLRLRAFLARAGDREHGRILDEEARRLAVRLPSAEERQLVLAAWCTPGTP